MGIGTGIRIGIGIGARIGIGIGYSYDYGYGYSYGYGRKYVYGHRPWVRPRLRLQLASALAHMMVRAWIASMVVGATARMVLR